MIGGEVNLWSIGPNLEMIYHRGELAHCQFGWEMSIVGVLGVRHIANTQGLEPVAFHRIQCLRRGAEG